MEGFGQLDHASGVAGEHLRVDVAHRGDAHDADPRLVFAEDVEHLLLVHLPLEPVGRRAQRQREVEAVVVGSDVEEGDVAGRGGQRAVEVAGRVAQRIEVAVEARTRIQQRHLVVEAQLGVAGAHLVGGQLLAPNRHVGRCQLPHALLEPCGGVRGEALDALNLAVEAALPHRVADVEPLAGKELARGQLQQEPRGALVDAQPRKRGDVDEAQRYGGEDAVVEFADAVVDVGGEEGVVARGHLAREFEQRGAHRNPDSLAGCFVDDLNGVGHVFSMSQCVKVEIICNFGKRIPRI